MQAILFTDVTTDPELFVGFQKHLKCGYALLFFKYVVHKKHPFSANPRTANFDSL